MKKILFLLIPAVIVLMSCKTSVGQKYKTTEDSVKLNMELVEVSNDVAELQSKLTIAQNNLPGYHSRSANATSDAQGAAAKSSEQASKATNGNMKDMKNAKKKAGKALKEAEDAKDADDDVKDQDKKIAKLSEQLQKKQVKMQELLDMRTAIRNLPR